MRFASRGCEIVGVFLEAISKHGPSNLTKLTLVIGFASRGAMEDYVTVDWK